MNKLIQFFSERILTFYFVLCLTFPTSSDLLLPKLILFIILFATTITFNFTNLKFNKLTLFWLIALCIHGICFSMLGILNNGVGALKMLQVSSLWPFLYFFLFSSYNVSRLFRILEYSIVISAVLIMLISVSLMLSAQFMDFSKYLALVDFLSFGSTIGTTDMISVFGYTIPGLMSVPFILGYLVFKYIENRKYRFGILFFALVVFLSGRNAIYLVFIISPFFLFLVSNKSFLIDFKRILSFYLLLGILMLSVFVLLFNFYDLDLGSLLIDNFSDSNNLVRKRQADFLLSGFLDHPFFGVGLGVPHNQIIRNSISPWSYELSYHAMLYQTGLIGTIFYLLLIILPILFQNVKFSNLFHHVEIENRVAFSFGVLSLLVANYTNPYFYRFDAIWIIILIPFFLLNLKTLRGKI